MGLLFFLFHNNILAQFIKLCLNLWFLELFLYTGLAMVITVPVWWKDIFLLQIILAISDFVSVFISWMA